jgi:DNA-directed RNA polymerase specialized sigma24 family protein
LSGVEAQELRSDLWLQLLENRRGLLDRLGSAVHPERYLGRVATNLVLDGYIARYGKCRPRATSRGTAAGDCGLDRHRADACLETPRRRFVGESVVGGLASPSPSPLDERRRALAQSDARLLRRALRQELTGLSKMERRLLFDRYVRQRTVADIAAAHRVEAKRLYRQYETILGRVRRQLHAAGFDEARVHEVLEHRGLDAGTGAIPA